MPTNRDRLAAPALELQQLHRDLLSDHQRVVALEAQMAISIFVGVIGSRRLSNRRLRASRDAGNQSYFLPDTSTSTRRSGCRQSLSFLVTALPMHSSGFVTGFDPSTPVAEILLAGIPAESTR